MRTDLSIHCSSPRCHEVMTELDDVYCEKCMGSKDDDIKSLEADIERLEFKIQELEKKNAELYDIIQACEACSALHAGKQL